MRKKFDIREYSTPNEKIQQYLKEFATGKKDAFDHIARYYMPQLQAIARLILKSSHDAEDVVQESLIKAYKALDNFRGEASISTWLCRIVINQANSFNKSSYKRKTVFLEDRTDQERLNSVLFGTEEHCNDDQVRKNFIREINNLPPKYRLVVKLRMTGLSYNQIAVCLNCSVGTVKSQLSRAKNKLRERIRQIKDDC
ncbi:MAG: RNA polymerase sigma factor [Lentisphaerae bacterium]|nr:RNA polymerase sigma factor [Lentisphaerota bacterium]